MIECRLVPSVIVRIMGGILIYGGDEKMFAFDIVVTTLVAIAIIILGFVFQKMETSTDRGIVIAITMLYVLCLFGMWF